jgi:alpha/beta superfamily hydrolase
LPHMAQQMFDASRSASHRDLQYIKGATHYFENQPELLTETLDTMASWISDHVGGL